MGNFEYENRSLNELVKSNAEKIFPGINNNQLKSNKILDMLASSVEFHISQSISYFTMPRNLDKNSVDSYRPYLSQLIDMGLANQTSNDKFELTLLGKQFIRSYQNENLPY